MMSVSIVSRAKAGEGENLLQAWLAAARATVAEDAGCRVYHVTRSTADADVITIFALYESAEALAAHNASPRSKELLPPIIASSDGPPIIHTGPAEIITR